MYTPNEGGDMGSTWFTPKGLNMGMLTLFLWQAFSGMEIVTKIWTNR